MSETDIFCVDIKESTYEGNEPIRRLLAYPDGILDTGCEYQSKEAAELDVIRLSKLGSKELRLQSAEHDPTEYNAYIVTTGKETGGYGRTTRNASSGWEYSRKVTIERDDFTCQNCGSVGGPEGNAELHVDHITPQSEGGSDDPENLQTLCRDCHMTKHGSSGEEKKATEGEIAQSIIQLAQKLEAPAFERYRLYDLLNDSLTGAVSGRVLSNALDMLLRYDRVDRMTLQYKFEDKLTEEIITKEHNIYYLVAAGFDPSRLSYNGKLQYNGEPIEYRNVTHLNGRQTKLDDFGD